MIKLLSVTVLMLLLLNLQGQTKKPVAKAKSAGNAAFIIGSWRMVQAPSGDGMNMSQNWVFTKNTFSVEGYPELKQKGMYKVISSKADTLTLKLYKQEGHWGTADKEQKIVINKQKSSINMGWLEFKRKE